MILCKEIVMESETAFWFFRLLLFAIFVFCGWGISYKNKDNNYFWYYGLLAIVSWMFIEGLRYGRGPDYYHYSDELVGKWDLEFDREPLYQLFVDLYRSLGLHYCYAFILYSWLLVTGFVLTVKNFKQYAWCLMPLFFLINMYQGENMIRQFIAISFLFFAYSSYLKGKKVSMAVYLCIIPLIHLSGLMAVGVFLGLYFFDPGKYIRSAVILLGIYIAIGIVWNIAGLYDLTGLLSDAGDATEGSYYSGYLDNADRWFTEEGSRMIVGWGGEVSWMRSVAQYALSCVLIWFGFLTYRNDERLRIPFWFTYISILINAIGGEIEIIDRFAWWLKPFECYIAAAILCNDRINRYWKGAIWAVFLVAYLYLNLITEIGQPRPTGFAFIWDIV